MCEQENVGPCLFCGAWVDRETMQDLDEENEAHYQTALEHRDKLIDFDVNAARRLGVLDEKSDWYAAANNTWLNKDQREYAAQMLEVQKQKEKEIDRQHVLTIDFGKGEAKIEQQENTWAQFGTQNEQVNKYMAEYGVGDALNAIQSTGGNKFKPFEFQSGLGETEEQSQEQMIDSLNNFQFKACNLTDEKSSKLYEDLNPTETKKKRKAQQQATTD